MDWYGWKNFSKQCHESGDKFIKCMEDKFYSKNDIFIDANISYRIKTFYFSMYKGIVQSLDFEKGIIRYDFKHTVDISLNHNITYEVVIIDPKAQILSPSNSIIPRSKIKLSYGSPTTTEIYLKVKTIYEFVN